ncbi:AAA family ATPase [Chryseobacterium arthrosphaerae]|uniref:AAA family ATPase n=1 Tax=Chryseobacterium arthrosphaerae TaxID=651561 RepID=A0ABU7QTX3_9FLAO
MLPVNIFGLKNFRIFDDQQGILENFSAINLLTGTNNSGKSSIIKGLQLLKNSVSAKVFPYELDLTEQEHLLGNLENVLYKKTNKKIAVSLPFNFLGMRHGYISLTYVVLTDDPYRAKLRKVQLSDAQDGDVLLSFAYKNASKADKARDLRKYKKDSEEYEKLKADPTYKKRDFYIKYGIFGKPDGEPPIGLVNWSINTAKLKSILSDGLEISDYHQDNQNEKAWLEKVLEKEGFRVIPSILMSSFKPVADRKAWISFLNRGLKKKVLRGSLKVADRDFDPPEYFYPQLEIEGVFYSSCLEILRDNLKWIDVDTNNQSNYNVIEHAFLQSMYRLEQRLFSVNYLSTVREQHVRIYNASLNTPFINLLKGFLPLQGDSTSFLNRYLQAFEIGRSLYIDFKQDYQLIFVSVIDMNGEKRELVDFGYGIKQLILLLIQICVLAEKNKREVHEYDDNGEYWRDIFDPSLLLIEEPETNLHPKWQSLLAEMFFEANKRFNIQLIIETHSEYLIRKFQNLVAAQNAVDLVKIFYLRHFKNINGGNKQIEVLNIENDGSIPFQVFDGGFFDESNNLQLSLLNIRRDNFVVEFESMKTNLEDSEEKIFTLEAKIDEFDSRMDISRYLADLELLFDTSKLEATTVKYLASGQFLLNTITLLSDFSPVILQYGRALENELKKVFYRVDPGKKWMLGGMQSSLEKFKFGRSSLNPGCSSTEFAILVTQLADIFNRPRDLLIENIDDLRIRRNAVAHAGQLKSKIDAEQYVLDVNEFLSEWIYQTK